MLAILVMMHAHGWRDAAAQVDERFWFPNGTVYELQRVDSTLYLGGTFTKMRCWNGAAGAVDATTAEQLNCMHVIGEVNVIAPDGSGGWYLGGTFTQVSGEPRANLAHLASDFSVSSWNPSTDGEVFDIVSNGANVFVAGNFGAVNGVGRTYIAQIDAATGAVTDWNPSADDQVLSLALSGSVLYAGGFFHSIGGEPRGAVAAFDAVTGQTTPWNPNVGGHVRDIAVSGSKVYVGGVFSNVGVLARKNLAAIDADTGVPTSWSPVADYTVHALLADENTVYVGGAFHNLAGAWREGIGAVSASTGNVLAWPGFSCNPVYAMARSGSTIYLAPSLLAVDAVTGTVAPWNPAADGGVNTVTAVGSTVFIGGSFSAVGGIPRSDLAAINTRTGLPTSWIAPAIETSPGFGGNVYDFVLDGSIMYIAGYFFRVGGQSRSNLAAFDVNTGTVLPFNPTFDASVSNIELSGGRLYAGGAFTRVNNQTRKGMAVFEMDTGQLSPWYPPTYYPPGFSVVYAFEISGPTVYLAGRTPAGDYVARAYDIGTGAQLPWAFGTNQPIYVIRAQGSNVYVGGAFSSLSGVSRDGVAKVDATTGSLVLWNPLLGSPTVNDIFLYGPNVYLAGTFTSVRGTPHRGLAAIDTATALLDPDWDAEASSATRLELGPQMMYVAGFVYESTGLKHPHFSAVAFPEGPVLDAPPAAAPAGFALGPVSPNPAMGAARIEYRLAQAGDVRLGVFDLQGREVARLVDGPRSAGAHHVTWSGRAASGARMSPGVYHVVYRGEGWRRSARLILLR